MRSKFSFLVVLFLFASTIPLAQAQVQKEKESIYVVVRDILGERVEGYLRPDADELTVLTKDNQEKSVPLKWIESIRLEKIKEGIPGAEQLGGESYYSVRLQNSQEILTLKKKYTFSLNTSLGVVTKTIDPVMVQDLLRKDSPPPTKSQSEPAFIRDKSAVFSLEIQF